MKKFLAVVATMALAPAAHAQTAQPGGLLGQILGNVFGGQQATDQSLDAGWNQGERPFAERRAALEARIDAAVRDGSLSADEAERMNREYDDIVALEARYAVGGISPDERRELRTRYRALVQRVGGPGQGVGGGYGGQAQWQPLYTRNADFDARVAAALRDRTLTQTEAARLRADWQALNNLEAAYGRNGLDAREQADLQSRLTAIDQRLGGAPGGGYAGGYGAVAFTGGPLQWRQLEQRLAAGERQGAVNRIEAMHMRAQLADLARLDAAYAAGGYSTGERAYLTRRVQELDAMIARR